MNAICAGTVHPAHGCRAGRPRGLEAMPRRMDVDRVPRGRSLGAMPRRVEVDLSPRAVEQVAQRVAQLLGHRDTQRRPELLTADELARELRVERPWIYKHRHMLGGERIGDGPKAPWRFDEDTATRALARHRRAQSPAGDL